MSDPQASTPAAPTGTEKSNPVANTEKARIIPVQPNNPETISLLNQKEQAMTKILQDAQEARNNLKSETPTPDSKLLAGAKAVAAATILSTTGLAQDALKPKVQPAGEVQLAPTEMVTEEELFTLAKYRAKEDVQDRWPTLDTAQQQQVRKYFALGLKAKLDERNLKKFGLKLMSFYETANEQKRVVMGDDSVQSVLSLTIIGQQLEDILPESWFAKKWVELDSFIKEYLTKTTSELRKETSELRKETSELRKKGEQFDEQKKMFDLLLKRFWQL